MQPLHLRSSLVLFVALLLAGPALVAQEISIGTERATLVAHLADRTTRDLEQRIADLQVAPESEQPALLAEIVLLASERSGYLVETFRSAPDVALGLLLTDSDRALVDALVPGNTAQPCTLSGALNVYAESETGVDWESTSYRLFETTSQYELRLHSPGETLASLPGGSQIQVNGFLLGDELLFDGNAGALSVVAAAPALPATPRFLAVRVNIDPMLPLQFPPSYSQAGDLFQAPGVGIAAYYAENSYGATAVTLDVTTVPQAFGTQAPISLGIAAGTIPVFQLACEIQKAVIQVLESQNVPIEDYYGITALLD